MPKGIGENSILCNGRFKWCVVYVSVSEPDSLSPDLDPDPIQIQGFYDQKLKKQLGKNWIFFFIKNCYLLISRPP